MWTLRRGREVGIAPYVAGVMSNPNCEYEANFVALRTLYVARLRHGLCSALRCSHLHLAPRSGLFCEHLRRARSSALKNNPKVDVDAGYSPRRAFLQATQVCGAPASSWRYAR